MRDTNRGPNPSGEASVPAGTAARLLGVPGAGARAAAVACLAFLLVLSGCAARVTGEEDLAAEREGWECVPAEGAEPAWIGRGSGWTLEGGAMVSAHSSDGDQDVPGLAPTRDAAVTDAISSAVSSATDLLARRGVHFEPTKREEIERRAVRAITGGREPTLPRVGIRGRLVERCESRAGDGAGWRARVLADYPVGRLRGDVNNVVWERERLVREVGVLRESAGDFFVHGRWLDGVSELGRAAASLARGGFPRPGDVADDEMSTVETEADFLRRGLAGDLAEVLDSLELSPAGPAPAVEAGSVERASMAVSAVFSWGGSVRPALGVPILYAATGGVAIVEGDAVTDAEGRARCEIVAAYGGAGGRSVEVVVDAAAVAAAAGRDVWRLLDAPGGGGDSRTDLPGLALPFYVVEGGHGTTVCLEVEAESEADAAVVRQACAGALARDGFVVMACGPDADLLLEITASVSSYEDDSLWWAETAVEVSAVDQRSVESVGETTIAVFDEIGRSRRDSEVAVLREAGRLAAVYLSRRGARRSSTASEKRPDES